MKEPYFTYDTIDGTAKRMVNIVNPVNRFELRFKKTALIVIDMQRYFLDPSSHAFVPSSPAIVQRILNLAICLSAKNRPVILTRHLNTTDNAGMLATWWNDIIEEKNIDSHLIPELKNFQDTVIHKTQYDAFHKTELEDKLRSEEVSQVIITGVMTHLCCETTARSAFVKGFQVFFPVDGTATYNREHHDAALLNLSHGFAQLCLTSELISQIKRDDDE